MQKYNRAINQGLQDSVLMNKCERIKAALRREAVDRVPIALWRHFPGDDEKPEDLARATLAFQQRFDFDFIKVSPSNAYAVTDWGSQSIYRDNPDGSRDFIQYAIREPHDWEHLEPLDARSGVLGRQLECLRLLHREIGGKIPFIQTVFNPLMVAKYLAGPDFVAYMRENPKDFHRALEKITETTAFFAREAILAGADGIFLAAQHATHLLLSEAEYREFGVPYDLRILEAAQEGWFNLLHVHGQRIMFRLLSGYPVQAINWHDRETWPSLREARKLFGGALVGGLARHDDLLYGSPERVRERVADAIRQTKGDGLVLGAGCVVPLATPETNIYTLVEAVTSLKGGP